MIGLEVFPNNSQIQPHCLKTQTGPIPPAYKGPAPECSLVWGTYIIKAGLFVDMVTVSGSIDAFRTRTHCSQKQRLIENVPKQDATHFVL